LQHNNFIIFNLNNDYDYDCICISDEIFSCEEVHWEMVFVFLQPCDCFVFDSFFGVFGEHFPDGLEVVFIQGFGLGELAFEVLRDFLHVSLCLEPFVERSAESLEVVVPKCVGPGLVEELREVGHKVCVLTRDHQVEL